MQVPHIRVGKSFYLSFVKEFCGVGKELNYQPTSYLLNFFCTANTQSISDLRAPLDLQIRNNILGASLILPSSPYKPSVCFSKIHNIFGII